MTNPFLEAGRLRKVAALVALLQAHQIPATRVEAMTYGEWVALAAKANVKPPGADTQAAVLAALSKSEALARSASACRTAEDVAARDGEMFGGSLRYPRRDVPRYAEIGNGLFVRVGRRR